jgi:hypothetical protein
MCKQELKDWKIVSTEDLGKNLQILFRRRTCLSDKMLIKYLSSVRQLQLVLHIVYFWNQHHILISINFLLWLMTPLSNLWFHCNANNNSHTWVIHCKVWFMRLENCLRRQCIGHECTELWRRHRTWVMTGFICRCDWWYGQANGCGDLWWVIV